MAERGGPPRASRVRPGARHPADDVRGLGENAPDSGVASSLRSAPWPSHPPLPATTADGECVFCAICAGRAPASFVHEDLAALPAGAGARMFGIAHELAAALRRTDLRCEGIDLFLADGEAAGQEIPHVHLHVIPRHTGDGFALAADWRVRDREELAEVAAKVRAAR
ncbi:HIT family protein [Amycolatopsis sp. NPDC049691]|uniref:HIT family protein n=1 Tax=Amycolatopsis sp. NPDC049691 TaxID=3155155 RepID=UPI0034395361